MDIDYKRAHRVSMPIVPKCVSFDTRSMQNCTQYIVKIPRISTIFKKDKSGKYNVTVVNYPDENQFIDVIHKDKEFVYGYDKGSATPAILFKIRISDISETTILG